MSTKEEQYTIIGISRTTRRRIVWFLLLRLCVATLFLGGTIVYQQRVGLVGRFELSFLYGMIAVTYLQSAASLFVLQNTGRLNLLTQTIIAYDLLLATFLLYLTGGFESHFSFLYLLIIFSSSLFACRRDIMLVASAATILFGSLLDLQYYQKLPLLSGLTYAVIQDGDAVFYSVFLHATAFFLSAFLCSVLVESRSKSELALEKKEIDLDELESLNRSILANINSGLMLINDVGCIRSFNRAAEEITGSSFYDVYDRDVRKIFPCFDLFDTTGFNHIIRGETDFQSKSGQILTLGYSTTEVRDVEQKNLGLLVVFQDLTESIEMDLRLRRADQQAAVGRLASGMAHEIRNPLAAISGSVQLLLEGGDVDIEDRRLMEIVVSEADRLSLLLTDFLSFAKPQKTELEKFDFSELCDLVIDMLQSDHRFISVTIIREYPPDCTLLGDQKQLQQVMLDLAINAAESMNGDGTLYIGINPETATLYVEDTGDGIAPDMVSKIFEPFFTTKQAGTGLGLATVHAVIAAHAGCIDLLSGRQGGTKFVITLPQQGQQAYALFNTDGIVPEFGKNES